MTGKITTDELVAMFGPTIPMDAYALLQTAPDDVGVDRVRELLREIATGMGRQSITITDETKAELRRLHAEFTRADEQLARATLNANERRMRQEAADEAERYLAHAWIGHGPSVLDALAAAEAERDRLMAGPIGKIVAERRRQVEEEGWTAEHDDKHDDGEMARAAGCYASHAGGRRDLRWTRGRDGDGVAYLPRGWPWQWHWSWWKPTTTIRDLIKAGALIVAEIERLDRAALGDTPCP